MKDFDSPAYHAPKEKALTVKELDPEDQPRERARKYGIGVLSTPDLWAIILRTGMVGHPITEICRDIMRSSGGSLFNLERQSLEVLLDIPGIGELKALQIQAVMEITRRYMKETTKPGKSIKSSLDIYNLMRPEIGNLPHEEIWILFLNRSNRVIGEKMMTRGGSVASVFDLKIIIRDALARHAEGLVMVHNHPSGNMQPSLQDDQITRRLKEACTLMDIRMLDHVIVSSDSYYSYQDQGRL